MSHALIDGSVRKRLAAIAEAHPKRAALQDDTRELNYEQLVTEAACSAGALSARGLRQGDRLGVSLTNTVELVTLFLGALQRGVTWVGLNPALGAERANVLDRARPALTVVEDDAVSDFDGRHKIIGRSEWLEELGNSEPDTGDVDQPLHAAAIAFTTGTSGTPKGVILSQASVKLPAIYLSSTVDFLPPARVGICLSASVLNVMIVSVLPTLLAGARAFLLGSLHSSDLAAQVAGLELTTISAPPTTYYDFATRDNVVEQLRTLQMPRCGGSSLTETIRELFHAKFGTEITGTYGLTEAPTLVTADVRGSHVAGSSGRPVPYLWVTIRSPDDTIEAPNTRGEICIQASREGAWAGVYQPMLGYFDDRHLSTERLRGGVLHTGDVGMIDDDGNLLVLGRTSECITRGGATLYPVELEEIVAQHPSISHCAVVGVPDERLGEAIGLVLECAPDQVLDRVDVLRFCAERLARYKRPDLVAIIDEMPRNAMGKVVKSALGEVSFVRADDLYKQR